ncbi:MAG: isochorismatase family protein [Paracoccaceae bacterium]
MKQTNDAHSNDLFKILISPALTALVIVDHQMAFGQCFDFKAVESAEIGVAELLGAAEKINIPVIASLVKTNLIGPELSPRLESMISTPALFNRSGINPWNDPAFARAVQDANRPNLLIAGLSAETSLSFTALCALERGYDVHVVRDACLGYSEYSIATTFDRLMQAGVVPVSWRQVILEWSQGNVDAGLLRRILKSVKST